MAPTDEASLSMDFMSGPHTLPGVQVYKGTWRHTDVAVKRFLEQDLSPQLMKVGGMLC